MFPHNSRASWRSEPPLPPTFPRPCRTEPIYEALYAFTPETSNQLGLIENEILVVLAHCPNGGGWSLAKRRYGDEQGWVPSAFLQAYIPTSRQSNCGTSRTASNPVETSNTAACPPPGRPAQNGG
ncbi:hypothetical protein BC567DRAFT_227613 [Phyllosticta citribraziliensis]